MSTLKTPFASIVLFFVFCLIVSKELLALQDRSEIDRPKIKVSDQTTFISEPLRADGLPNYRQWLLERQRTSAKEQQGLNGAIPFWQACWPAGISEKNQLLLKTELGIGFPNQPGPFANIHSNWQRPLLVKISEWIVQTWSQNNQPVTRPQLDQMNRFAGRYADKILVDACTRPFTAADRPMIAEWIRKHKAGFDLIDAAAACDYFYSPSPSFLQNEDVTIVDIELTFEKWIRHIHRVISMRTNLLIGEGDYQNAWKSCLTGIRLAKITNPKDFLYAVEVMTPGTHFALNEMRQLAIQTNVPSGLLREMQSELDKLFPEFSRARAIHMEARISWLEIAIQWSQGTRPSCFDSAFNIFPEQVRTAPRPDIDWNLLLQNTNEAIDELVEIGDAQGRERIERHKTLMEYWSLAPTELPFGISPSILTCEARTVLTKNMLLKNAAFWWSAAFENESRVKTDYELTRAVIALAIYRQQHGRYPDAFGQVVPKILNTIPVDHYCGGQLQYRRTDDGFLLYSLGANGIDDSGDNHFLQTIRGFDFSSGLNDFDQIRVALNHEVDLPQERHQVVVSEDSDDIAIRFPVPILRFPVCPVASGDH